MTVSRRRLLAAVAAAGGAGAFSGATSGALLADREAAGSDLTAGVVDLVVDYWLASGPGASGGIDPADPDGVVDGATIDVPIGSLTASAPLGSTLVRVALPQPDDGVNNPARCWLRTDCPEPSALAETLQVRLSAADADGTPVSTIAAGSLREVAEQLRAGVCLDPADEGSEGPPGCLTDELFVLVEYDLGGYVGAESAELPLTLAATQCRNADPEASPFPPAVIDDECEVGWTCDCCWTIGNVEVEDGFAADTTYPFDDGAADYAVRVSAVDGGQGVAFELVAPSGATVPPLCAVHVKGGPEDAIYERRDGVVGTDTSALDGATGGLVYAPPNPNSGTRYDISYVLVSVCAPRVVDGDCPDDLAHPAASVGSPGTGGPGRGRGGRER